MYPEMGCLFLTKLPYEVRVQIYVLVLGNYLIYTTARTTEHSMYFDPSTALWRASSAAHRIEWRYPSVIDHRPKRSIEISLLLTCRFVYHECRQLLYARNTFSFRDLQEFEAFSSEYLDGDNTDGEKRISWITKLQMACGYKIFKVPKVVFNASSLQLLSLGADPDTFLLAGLYAPHSDALRVLLKLSDLPKLTQMEIFWATWPPWCLSMLSTERAMHTQSGEEAKASSNAISIPLTSIASHPGGRHNFSKQHCEGGLTLVRWIQVQAMKYMRDHGYCCHYQTLYWTTVEPLLMVRTATGNDALEGNDDDNDDDDDEEDDEEDDDDDDDSSSTDEASGIGYENPRERALYENFVPSAEELDLEIDELQAEMGEEYENVYGKKAYGSWS